MPESTAPSLPEPGWLYAANGQPMLRYAADPHAPILFVEWQPGPPLDDVKHAFVELARLLRETRSVALLSGSNNFTGDWSELIPWVRYEFLPVVIANGLRYIADVQPLDPASSFSVRRWRDETRGLLQHEIFSNLAAARAWVVAQLQAESGS